MTPFSEAKRSEICWANYPLSEANGDKWHGKKAHMQRCASALVIATYAKSSPHSSGFAHLASESFYDAIQIILNH
jgi:hypothetical protein